MSIKDFFMGTTPSATTTNPEQTTTTTPESKELSPLDNLQKLLYPEPEKGQSGEAVKLIEPLDIPKLFEDPAAVDSILSSLDFTKSISPKTQELLESGKPEGFTAMVNDISKASFLEALKLSSVLTQKTIENSVERTLQKSKGQITESLGDYELRKEMPQIDNPVIKLGLEAMKERLKAQNPSMTANELATQLKTFLSSANSLVNTSSNSNEPTGKKQSWADWLDK